MNKLHYAHVVALIRDNKNALTLIATVAIVILFAAGIWFLLSNPMQVRSVSGRFFTGIRDDEPQSSASPQHSLTQYVVCIDAGHGSRIDLTQTPIGPGSQELQYVEPGGTLGVASGLAEYEVVLDIAMRIQDALEQQGLQTVMVRTTNDVVISSEERAHIANDACADLFLRLHADGSNDPSARGFTTHIPGLNDWTADIYENSKRAAQFMHPIIIESLDAVDGGIIERYDLAGFNYSDVTSVLFEVGYMSNYEEDLLLATEEYRQLLADSIANACILYLESLDNTYL